VIQYSCKFINHDGDNKMLLNDTSLAQSPETNPERERNTLNRLRDSTAAKITAGTLTVVAGLGIANIFSGPESATVIEVTELDIDNDGIADVRTTTEVLGGDTTDDASEEELAVPETSEILNPDDFPFFYTYGSEMHGDAVRKIIEADEESLEESTSLGFRGIVVGTVTEEGQEYWAVLHNPILVFEGEFGVWTAPTVDGGFASIIAGWYDEDGVYRAKKAGPSANGEIQYYEDPSNPTSGQQVRFFPFRLDDRALHVGDDFAQMLSSDTEKRVELISYARLFTDESALEGILGQSVDQTSPEFENDFNLLAKD
jgi:hypothetical protein